MKKVLVVEDDEILREDLAEILSLANYKVMTAVNGKDGLEKTSEFTPDIIISDIGMPIVDGMGMLHILRNDPKTEDLPFIFLTARSDRNDFRNAMDSGADDFITKPFNGDELLKAVETRLKRTEIMGKHVMAGHNMYDTQSPQYEDPGNLDTLILNHDTIVFPKKQIIYKEGQMPHYLYYIKKGKIRTFKTHNDGKQLVLGLFNQGQFLGHIALLEETPYKEIAQAMEESELVLVPKKDFENLIHRNLSVANKVMKMLARDIAEHEQHLLGIAYNTLRKKVASALTSLFHKFSSNKIEPYYIDISRDELASIAGTATESLIRTLTEFKHEKLIDIVKDNKIEILNPKKLENLLR